MQIFVNERSHDTAADSTVGTVRAQCKADADVLIVNGYPADPDQTLVDGDRLVLIRRGEGLPAEEIDALLAARHSPGVHDRAKRATVGIAGAGGLGSAVAIAL